MDIILKQEDADFVANFIREQLSDLEEAYDAAKQDVDSKQELITSIADMMPEDDRKKLNIDKDISEMSDLKEKTLTRMSNIYYEKKTMLYKILELVMCGS